MFEAYSVAVRVSLINNVSSGLMNMSRAFAKVHGDAERLKRQLNEIKFLAIGGAVTAGAGLFGFHLIGKTMPYAKEYARQLALMNTLGMRQADIAKVVGEAWKASYAVPSTTAAQNLASFRELRSAFGSDPHGMAHAAQMLPTVARLAGVMQSMTGKAQEHVGFDMVKAIELRTGVMTTQALQRNADLMSKAIIGMGGTISVADFHGALKMGKVATNRWSDTFTYQYLPTLMQEMKTASGGGAQSAGTMLMSLYQQMHGRMTKAAMPLWVESGLVRPQDVVKNAGGQYQVKPGGVAGTDLFETNPYEWVQRYLRPAVDRLSASRHISAETAINSMFSNRNAAMAAYNMYFKAAQYERDRVTISKADGGYAAYQKLLKTDPTLAQQALQSQWQNLLGQIGFQIMPTLVRGTLMLVNGLKALSSWVRAHPNLTKGLVGAFAALSAVLVFSGTVWALSAAWKALQLTLSVLQVAKIASLSRGIMAIARAAPGAASAVVALGGGLAGLAAVILNVVAPALAAIGAGIVIAKGFNLARTLRDPKHASHADLIAASQMIAAESKGLASDIAHKRIGNNATTQAVARRYASQAHTLAEEAHRRRYGEGSPYVAPKPTLQKQSMVGVYLDKRLVGKAVFDDHAAALERDSRRGQTGVDRNMSLVPVSLAYT